MASNLAASVTSFLICFIMLPLLIEFFKKRNVLDKPGGRKIHKKVTPSMGGIPIFLGIMVAILIWMNASEWEVFRYVLAGLFFIFIIGLRDDIVPMRAKIKLLGQILTVVILLYADIRITSLYGFFGIHTIPIWLSYIFTGVFLIAVVNAFNLIDGLDGLAGSVSAVILAFFAFWFYFVGEKSFALISFSMFGGIVAFLIFNWEPSEIFMGDTGALVVGLGLGIMTVRFMEVNFILPDGNFYKFNSTIFAAAGILAYPMWDTTRIILLRLTQGKSPFSPDKSHIHHALMRLGLNHAKVSLLLSSFSFFVICLMLILRSFYNTVVGFILTMLIIILSITIDRLVIQKMKRRGN